MPVRIAVLDDYQEVARRYGDWASLAPEAEVTVFHGHIAGDDSLAEHLEGFDVVIAMRERTPFTAKRLAKLPDLKLIVTTGMANAAIDMDATRERGITVCGTGGLASPTAELTWALILATVRHVVAEDGAIRAGRWQHTIGPELAGHTLGVLGLGRLGTRVAQVAQAFAMDVVAWSQNLDPDEARAKGVEPVEKDELLARADVVSIHLRLSERTRGLLGARELGLMKPTAVLVNTSRGPIVDEEALVEALLAGTIGGAGLDVFDVEPLPRDHPLRTAPRTVLTPHIGYVTTGAYEIYYREAVEDVAAWLRGEPVRVLNG
jgi:phosphoglycerate dehydrogenase-like enzyme